MKHRKLFFSISIIVAVLLAIGITVKLWLDKADIGTSGENISLDDKKPVNFLLIGGDNASKNTDTIMVINYDPTDNSISVLSVPRDTRVVIKDRDRKVNFAYPSGGSDLIKETINKLTGIKIDRFIYLDLAVFKEVVNALGGVEYTVPVDLKYDDNAQDLHIDLKAGRQLLDGEKAEQLFRFRKPNSFKDQPDEFTKYYNGSDINRINAQQTFFKELIEQKVNLKNLPGLIKAFDIIFEKLKTDLTLEEISYFARKAAKIDSQTVATYVLSGTEKTIEGVWYFEHDGNFLSGGAVKNSADVVRSSFISNTDN